MKKILIFSMLLILVFSFVGCDMLEDILDELDRDADADVSFDDGDEHEHSFRWERYEDTHCKIYTCGCPTPEIAGIHVDNDADGKCDECKYRMHLRHDHETVLRHDDGYHWFDFVCGCDVETSIDPHLDDDENGNCDVCGYYLGDDPTPPANHFLRNQAGCEWLYSISAEDVAEIKIISRAVGVAPGNLCNVSSSTNEAVIGRLLEEYYWLDTAPIPVEEGQISGGGAITVQFILNDGCVKELYINNGNYRDTNGNYFKLLYTPNFKDAAEYTKAYRFITYDNTGAVYLYGDGNFEEGNEICVIDCIGELEFTECESFPLNLPRHAIKTQFGQLDIYGNVFFTYNGKNCQLANGDFYEMFEAALSQDYSVTMNDAEWLYEELQSKYKFGEVVSVKIKMAYDLGYLFLVNGEKINVSRDVSGLYWEFAFTMPNCDVVIDFKTYDGFLPDHNYAVLIETYWLKNLRYTEFVNVSRYYGEFESGAIVAMIDAGGYDDEVWHEVIDGFSFYYHNSNRITVLYEGEFYTLTDAYKAGYITHDDLATIADLHSK